jgi:hypothetical protein
VLAVVNGLAAVVVGFLLIIIGLLGPSAQSSPIVSSTVGPFLIYFSAVSQYSYTETVLVGFVAFVAGSIAIAAAYGIWRQSKKAASVPIVVAVLGEVLAVTYLVILALAVDFTILYTALLALQILMTVYGWKHLK